MAALLSVIIDILFIASAAWFVWQWITTHDPNYGILVVVLMLIGYHHDNLRKG